MGAHLDFGYPWWLGYGHLVITGAALALWLLGRARRWSRAPMILIAVVGLWSVAGFLVARLGLNVNGRMTLPTARFLASGSGRVLDVGAGTGRSTLMVLEARPRATVVALDLFTESYEHHFGPGKSGQERLMDNLSSAGVAERATVQAGDMRQLPFEPATFDAVVSTYAMEHLNREGSLAALREAARVLKPGGEFLMAVVERDFWGRFAFGPLLAHGGARSAGWWTAGMQAAGFQVLEQGTRPATLYVLARKP
jgi:SAM-dependent methyltransferase